MQPVAAGLTVDQIICHIMKRSVSNVLRYSVEVEAALDLPLLFISTSRKAEVWSLFTLASTDVMIIGNICPR